MGYEIFEHRHRFAVWAAARATQRAFTTVAILRDAVESSSIVAFVREPASLEIDRQAFEVRHRQWCTLIAAFLEKRGVESASFGRAAKLTAIYLKSMVVVAGYAHSQLAAVAHPPIDRILLQKLAASEKVSSPHKSAWRRTNWTTLKESSYYILISQLRAILPDGEPFWKLEEFWTVTNEKAL